MAIKNFKGELLREARQMRRMTITELAEKTGISKQSLSLYENGENKPDGDNVFKLAQQLQVPFDYFIQSDGIVFAPTTTYFRSLSSITKKARISINLKLKYIARMYEALSELITFPTYSVPHNFPELIHEDEVENIAENLRQEWELGNEPIEDMQYLLESHGILVTAIDADDVGIDAFSKKFNLINDGINKDVYIVAINKCGKTLSRINFDLAHELGHILMHPWTEDLESLSHDEFRNIERQANKFAGAFLMPAEKFRESVSGSNLAGYNHLRNIWHVSIQAMIYRAHELECISLNQYQYLMRKISQLGWRKIEPGDEGYEPHKNVFESAIDLLKEDGFSARHIINLFKKYGVLLYPSDIEDLLGLENGSLTMDSAQDVKKILYIRHGEDM